MNKAQFDLYLLVVSCICVVLALVNAVIGRLGRGTRGYVMAGAFAFFAATLLTYRQMGPGVLTYLLTAAVVSLLGWDFFIRLQKGVRK